MHKPSERPILRPCRALAAALCAVALALPACGGEAKKVEVTKAAKVEAKAPPTPETKAEVPPPAEPAEKPAPDPKAEKVEIAARVAKEIAADPEHADEVLTRHGLDRARLDAMMFEIASDPALTEAYMAARKAS